MVMILHKEVEASIKRNKFRWLLENHCVAYPNAPKSE